MKDYELILPRHIWSMLTLTMTLLMVSGVAVQTSAQISVSPNVHLSKELPNQLQAELLLDSDPSRPGRMMACSLLDRSTKNEDPSQRAWSVIVYLTEDYGKTWKKTFEEFGLMDPTCAYAPDGTALLQAFNLEGYLQNRTYRSADGGRTWTGPVKNIRSDRPYLTVDLSNGPFRGRVYSHGYTSGTGSFDAGPAISGIRLQASLDGGRTFEDAVQRHSVPPRRTMVPGNGVVLSDGTLVIPFGELKEYSNPDNTIQLRDSAVGTSNARMRVVTSTDGGRTMSAATTIADAYLHVYPWRPASGFISWIAADSTTGTFKDRVYVVWPDRRSGRVETMFAYSSDKGRTWSRPVVLNDDHAPVKRGDSFMPVIAVNNAGVVGVYWYDRRDHPDNRGWDIWFTASLDGGETWSPNLRVSEKSNIFNSKTSWPVILPVLPTAPAGGPATVELWVNQMLIFGGDTTGITTDAKGSFHLAWADNRTNTLQLWTSAVTVKGKAERNGDPVLATYKDVSSSVRLETGGIDYNRETGEVIFRGRLKNVGTQPVAGQLKLRVLQVYSDLGVARIENAENHVKGAGAIWDFTPLLNGKPLAPGEATPLRDLRFRVSDVQFPQSEGLKFGLVKLDVRVLAKGEK
ncbi:MAG TPA: sialidase family protein [Pyrinomonadaceae bacterium]|nr:sialidase family protein [Pyrinomonadaceae bacterium]